MGVTNLTGLQILPTRYGLTDVKEGDFFSFPQLTQEEIDLIQEDKLTPGIVIYNKTFNVYMAYMEERWNNLNTSLTYKGEGYEFGSPYAIPVGPKSVVEPPESGNTDPGAMYADSENDYAIRYCNGTTWADIGGGGGGSTFENITVTNNATIGNELTTDVLTVTNASHLNAVFAQDTNVTNLTASGAGIFQNSIDVTNDVNVGRYFTGTTPHTAIPPITVSLGGGAGTGATYQIFGSVMSGQFQLTVPSGTTFSDTIIATFTLPISEDFTSYGYASFSPENEIAALAMTTKAIYSRVSQIGTGGAPTQVQLLIADAHELDSNVTYVWEYFIMGNKQLI